MQRSVRVSLVAEQLCDVDVRCCRSTGVGSCNGEHATCEQFSWRSTEHTSGGAEDQPLGTDGLMAHEVMVPEPVMVGESGRSLLAVLLVKSKSFGEYAIVGTSSLTTMVMVVVFVPPELRTVIV